MLMPRHCLSWHGVSTRQFVLPAYADRLSSTWQLALTQEDTESGTAIGGGSGTPAVTETVLA